MRVALVIALSFVLIGCSHGPGIGEDGHLADHGQPIVVAPQLSDLEAAIHAYDVRDNVGIRDIAQSGRVFVVPSGTRVHVLSAAVGRWQVRILDGDHMGQSVWATWETLTN
jgi:hypothetical protein